MILYPFRQLQLVELLNIPIISCQFRWGGLTSRRIFHHEHSQLLLFSNKAIKRQRQWLIKQGNLLRVEHAFIISGDEKILSARVMEQHQMLIRLCMINQGIQLPLIVKVEGCQLVHLFKILLLIIIRLILGIGIAPHIMIIGMLRMEKLQH